MSICRKDFNDFNFDKLKIEEHPIKRFCLATQYSSSKKQYEKLKEKIQKIVGEKDWRILKDCGVGGEGKQNF